MIRGWLVGDKELVARFERFGPTVRSYLEKQVKILTMKLLTKVSKEKLSDQVLKVRTGRLRRSINQTVEADGDRVYGIVGTNVKYGAAWEMGFDRKVGAGARGGPRTLLGKARETYFARHPAGVKHYPARSFLRSALAEMQPEIVSGMEQAIRTSASSIFPK